MSITLSEILVLDDEEEWLSEQSSDDLEKLARRLVEMEYAIDPSDYVEAEDMQEESNGVLLEVQDLIKDGRVDDALLLIERTVHPRRSQPDADQIARLVHKAKAA